MSYEHIVRSTVPWREPSLTECGRSLADVAKVLTFDEAKARVQREGKQRALYSMCQTCVSTTNRNPGWASDPAAVIERTYPSIRWRPDDPTAIAARRELEAIAALIEAHRDEFDALVAGMAEVTDLRDRRRA